MKIENKFPLDFARFAGQLAEDFSFNRSVGQIYGLLYLSEAPLSLDQITQALRISKGNASVNLRTLEAWGAARSVMVDGSRRDYYEANRNLKEIMLRRCQEGIGKRLGLAEERLGALRAAGGAGQKRLEELSALLAKARKVVGMSGVLSKLL